MSVLFFILIGKVLNNDIRMIVNSKILLAARAFSIV